MKKKWLSPVIIIALILILIAAGFLYFANSSYGFSTGRCYVTQNGDYLIILGNDPIKMSDLSTNKNLFENLNTGDEIRILHDEIQESYPGGTGVYYCKLVQKGSIADIPETVIESLSPTGWIPVDDTGRTKEIYTGTVISYEGVHQDEGNFLLKLNTESGFTEEVTITVVQSTEVATIDGIAAGDCVRVQCFTESSGYKEATSLIEYQEVSYEYGFANMSLVLPAGWSYEIAEYDEESLAFGINFWPENSCGGKIRLEYWPNKFGVCGTGLTQEEIRLENGLRAWKGTYESCPVWDHIAIRDLPGSYVFCAQRIDDWWDDYQVQAMEIINSVKLADGIIWENAAIELAARALNLDDQPVRTDFDFCEGTWLIQFEEKGTTYNVSVDHEGNLGKISEYDPDANVARKPVIYLYPEEELVVTVKLDFDGTLTTTYLNGDMMDSAMNYDFRRYCRRFFAEQTVDAEVFDTNVSTLLLRYRENAVFSQLNLLDSHDVSRYLTLCGGDADKMELSILLQMTFPGMPCVFYGDEKGVQGTEEHEYRQAMPWLRNHPLEDTYRKLIALRKACPALRYGNFQTSYVSGHIYSYCRTWKNKRITVTMNLGDIPVNAPQYGSLLLKKGECRDIIGAWEYEVREEEIYGGDNL